MTLLKPYYETELGKLYHGDCLEILPNLKGSSLIITDPPYGKNIAKNGRVGGTKPFGSRTAQGGSQIKVKQYIASDWDKKRPPKEAFELMRKKSINQIIFGGNYFSDYLTSSPCWIVWDKETTGNFADCELIYTSFNFACRKITWRWNGCLRIAQEERFHPTQKPIGLIAEIIERYGQNSPNILDPYLGSGTTAIACERLNRRWIGIEIEERYCAIAKKRIEQERKQLKLF